MSQQVHEDVWGVRDLILTIRDEWEPGWDQAGLIWWLDQHPRVAGFLRDVGRPEARRPLAAGDDTLQALYAISRLVEIAIAPRQPVNDDPDLLAWTTHQPWWSGPLPAATVWPALAEAMGATPIAEDGFHPFFHEVVQVVEAEDPQEEPSLVAEHWTGAMVGSMLLQRAGVTVRAGRHKVDPKVAAHSALYFSWFRRNRRACDLSHGWGHNSQWRTAFRRDYVTAAELHYNVDARAGAVNPADDDTDITADERLQLLRYRHSLVRDLGHDRWPYHDRHVEPR